MNLITVVFWITLQALACVTLVALERTAGAVTLLAHAAPPIVWEVMIALIIPLNVAWLFLAATRGEAGALPRPSVRRAVQSLLFPPPAAARRGYPTRQRRIVP